MRADNNRESDDEDDEARDLPPIPIPPYERVPDPVVPPDWFAGGGDFVVVPRPSSQLEDD